MKKNNLRLFSFVKIMTPVLAAAVFMCTVPVFAASDSTYITEISVEGGWGAETNLEDEGYTVLSQKLNVGETQADDSTDVLIGYKTGNEDDAICGLLVAYEQAEMMIYDDIEYTLVSDVSLNVGTGGTPMWLYYTKDTNAGSAIEDFDFSVLTSEDEAILLNDGSLVVRDINGAAADFDEGIADSYIYLYTITADIFRPYISGIESLSAESEGAASIEASDKGYDYFAEVSGVFYGYNRTNVLSEVVTDSDGCAVIAVNSYGFTDSIALSSWGKIFLGGNSAAAGYMTRSAGYLKAIEDDSATCEIGTYALGNAEVSVVSADSDVQTVLEEYVQTTEQETVGVSGYAQERTDTVQEDLDYSESNIVLISAILLAVGLIVAVALILRARLKKADSKAKDEAREEDTNE